MDDKHKIGLTTANLVSATEELGRKLSRDEMKTIVYRVYGEHADKLDWLSIWSHFLDPNL